MEFVGPDGPSVHVPRASDGQRLQRFASLIVSATVLSPAYPPASLWAGIALVALGSAMYLGAPAARAVNGG